MAINVNSPAYNAGLASSDQDTIGPATPAQTGSFPVEAEIFELVDQNAVLPAFSLVGILASNNKATLATDVDGSDYTSAGLTAFEAADGQARVAVYRTGVFNPDVVNFADATGQFATIEDVKEFLRVKAPSLFLVEPKTLTPTIPTPPGSVTS